MSFCGREAGEWELGTGMGVGGEGGGVGGVQSKMALTVTRARLYLLM